MSQQRFVIILLLAYGSALSPHVSADNVNLALHKPVYSIQPSTELGHAVDGDEYTEAYIGRGITPFIAVDLGSQYVIGEVHILIRRAGKL